MSTRVYRSGSAAAKSDKCEYIVRVDTALAILSPYTHFTTVNMSIEIILLFTTFKNCETVLYIIS